MAEQPKSVGVLDSLPDHILCQILSFLPAKEAARTSVLSPRWRFFSNPNLLSLESFRVNDLWVNPDFSYDDDYLRIHGWICAALRRDVKEIVIFSIKKKDDLTSPALLFTSHTLVTLKLKINGVNDVPTNASLPNLKTLHFTFFEFLDGNSVLKLISSCPVLEDFAFIMCWFHKISELNIRSLSLKSLVLRWSFGAGFNSRRGYNAIKINAPNLVYFQYVNGMGEGCTLSEMKSLERAHIEIILMDNEDRERAANLLRGVCNVQSLYLAIEDDSETLFLAPLDPMPAFNSLVELEFRSKYTHDRQRTWIVEFIHRTPNLKTLILDLPSKSEGFESMPTIVPSCLLFQIKQIEIKHFEGEEPTFEMVSYFLKHGSVLEKLIIRDIKVCEEELSAVIEKLLSLPKESKKCEIVTPDYFH
ncbi:hypothetical protein like AT2G26030 [Hibiscus trionum]|uniref:F-box domain-containing protein n=1 Tax=Hibiscus trionum TaxID=183268 RepID=A0A9W7MQU6_HIBTR|nr:hypothetical protein like AT2G26030 [Hibiscus trionum]